MNAVTHSSLYFHVFGNLKSGRYFQKHWSQKTVWV